MEKTLQSKIDLGFSIFEEIDDYAIIVLDEFGTIENWNKGAEKIKGYKAGEIIGKNFKVFYPAEDCIDKKPDKLLLQAGIYGKATDEGWRVRKDGSTFWGSILITAIRNNQGRLEGFTKITRVLTHQKNSEIGISVANQIPAMLGYWDRNQICRFANNAYQDWFGKSQHEMVDKISLQELLGDLYEKNLPHITGVLQGQPQYFERTIVVPSGETRHAVASYSPDIQNGVVNGFYVHVTDVTPLKKLELSLKKSEAKFKGLLDSAPDATVIVNAAGNIELVNQQTVKLFGYQKEDLIGKPIQKLIPARFHYSHSMHFTDFFHHPKTRKMGLGMELYAKRSDGSEFPVEISLGPLETDDGHLISAAIRDISERKKTEKLLQISEEQFRGAFEHSAIGMTLISLDRKIIKINRSLRNILGYTEEEFAAANPKEIIHPDDVKLDPFKELLEKGTHVYQTEKRYFHKNGSVVWVLLNVSVVRDPANKPIHFVCQLEDITARKRAEQEVVNINKSLAEVTHTLQIATEAAHVGIWDWDVVNDKLTWDRNMFALYGIPAEEFREAYEVWVNALHPDDKARGMKDIEDALAGKRKFNTEFRIFLPDKSIRYIKGIASVQNDNAGKAIRMTGTNWDITPQKLAENEIKRSLERNKIFIEQSPTAIAMFDNHMRYLAASTRWIEDYGLTGVEIIGHSHYEIFPEISDAWRKIHQECLKGSINKNDEAYFKRADGTEQWISWDVRPWYIADNEIGGLIILTDDITARRKAEREIVKVNRQLEAILNAGDVSIIGTDTAGVITHFNKGAEDMLGYRADEMIGKNTPVIIHLKEEVMARSAELTALFGTEISGFDAFVALAKQGKTESREWTYRRKDGTTFPVQLVVTALKNADNEINGFLGVGTDITQRKKSEEATRKIATLESKSKEMEQFAYIASHDLREPLLTIKNYIEIFVEDYGQNLNSEAQRYMKSIQHAAVRMESLINDLLDYSRLSRPKLLEKVDCAQVVDTVLMDLDRLIKTSKAVITISNTLPELYAYHTEFKLLFQNLITNALKFRNKDIKPAINISAYRIEGGWQFAIKDNGIGIDKSAYEKIFTIFQRLHSRDDYEGTGIGLAHCKKIVEIHNGNIWVTSKPGIGSTFFFTILTEKNQ